MMIVERVLDVRKLSVSLSFELPPEAAVDTLLRRLGEAAEAYLGELWRVEAPNLEDVDVAGAAEEVWCSVIDYAKASALEVYERNKDRLVEFNRENEFILNHANRGLERRRVASCDELREAGIWTVNTYPIGVLYNHFYPS